MTVDLRGVTTVLLPGTGSDDDFVRRAFSAALRKVGAVPVTPAPRPERLVAGYRDALECARRTSSEAPIAVGGVSIGAAVALQWALDNPGDVVAVLAALPAWTGDAGTAPAAQAARYTADVLRRDGLEATTAQMQASSPPWLAHELARSWRGQWPALPDAMDEAARYGAPTREQLTTLTAPLAVVSAVDDAVHPLQIGVEWVSCAPRSALRTLSLDQIGSDPGALGRQCLEALAETDRRG